MKTYNKSKKSSNGKNGNRKLKHSVHSLKRMGQRGIKNRWIKIIIREGKVIFKQGLRFYYMTKKELRFLEPSIQDHIKNIVVVMAGDDNTIITCYKNSGAISRIKHKSKRLLKNSTG